MTKEEYIQELYTIHRKNLDIWLHLRDTTCGSSPEEKNEMDKLNYISNGLAIAIEVAKNLND